MQTRLIVVLCVAALAPALAASQQTLHRWVDKDGKVHYSDQAPPLDAKSTQQKRLGGGYVEVENLPYATQIAMKRNPVTLYSGAACGDPCASGRQLLTSRGIPFTEKDAQNNESDREALRKLVGGLDVPVLVVGSNTLKGYGEEEWQAALDAAGYPRTRLPGQAAAPRAPTPPTEAKAETKSGASKQ